MPLLFTPAIHDALAEVRVHLQWGEILFSYLDDVCVVSQPGRTNVLYDLLADRLHTMAGIQLHEGKTRTWNAAGECLLPRTAELVPDVWSPRGVKILGTPVGTDASVQTKIESRLGDERSVVGGCVLGPWPPMRMAHSFAVPAPDATIAPRSAHPVRGKGMPKDMTKACWQPRRLCWKVCRELMSRRRGLARVGGLGLPWADALHMVSQRLPEVAKDIVTQLEGEPEGCLAELQGAAGEASSADLFGKR